MVGGETHSGAHRYRGTASESLPDRLPSAVYSILESQSWRRKQELANGGKAA